ncbi:Type 1 glutamine amidotransferase-like domain-containing protein, partial [Enterococcus faecalis]
VQPEEEGESAPDFQRFAPGLALTDINILPHYQKVKNYILDGLRLYEDITFADSMGHTFFALPDGSYIYQDEAGQLLCGRAYRVRDGI